MKKNLFVAASMIGLALTGFAFVSCAEKAAPAEGEGEAQATEAQAEAPAKQKAVRVKPIGTLEDSLSYAYGVGLGSNLRENFEQMPADINMDIFMKAFEKAIKGDDSKLRIKPEHAYQVFQHCMMAIMQRTAQENKRLGAEFLAENAKREEVLTTESGLQYEVLVPAEGPKPTTADRVSVHYEGSLLDGTVFDSSIQRGNPAQFGVTQVIPGWTEGLQLMSVGSRYKFYIPSDLAYGDQGAGDAIAPGSMLIFEVELLDIIKK